MDRAANRVQLVQRGHAGLVRHDVLAALHCLDRERRAIPWNGRKHDEIDRPVVQQTLPIHFRHVRKAFAKTSQNARISGAGIVSDAYRSGLQQALGHVVNMAMVKSDRGEAGHFVSSPGEARTIFRRSQPRSTIRQAFIGRGENAMTDRIAVITGAGSGIGRASALALCKDGWSVALLGRRKDALEETAGLATGGKTLPIPTDVAEPDQVIAAFATVKEKFGRVDMLFNNAGGNVPSTNFGDFTWEMWRRVVAVNLDAMFMCANQAFRMMRDQTPRGGRIINNGSISAHVPRPGSVAYTSTKHGVTGLTKSIALDGREFDICSGQIDIGNAATPMTARSTNGQMQPYGQMAVEARMDVAHVGAAGGVHGQSAAGVQRSVRHDHGDQDAVHRARLSTCRDGEACSGSRVGHSRGRPLFSPFRHAKSTFRASSPRRRAAVCAGSIVREFVLSREFLTGPLPTAPIDSGRHNSRCHGRGSATL